MGYDVSNTSVKPGDTVYLTLYWKAQDELDINYQAFVHVFGPDGLVAQSDKLNPGEFPTRRWPLDKYVRDEKINAGEFWGLMGKTAVSTDAGDVWFLGEGAQTRNDHLLSLEAPNFTLPDFNGRLHSLTDFRRQRVLLITWASW